MLKKQYKQLLTYLEGKNACNFRTKKGEMVWTCFHDLRFTIDWLKKKGLDVKKETEWLNNSGGYCDCEVLFNSV